MSLRVHQQQHGERHTGGSADKQAHNSVYLRKALPAIKGGKMVETSNVLKQQVSWEWIFFEVVRKRSDETSGNSQRCQLRRGKQQRFQSSCCPKKPKSCVWNVDFFSLFQIPAGSLRRANAGETGTRCSGRGVGSGFFTGKNVKNAKDFRCHVKAIS